MIGTLVQIIVTRLAAGVLLAASLSWPVGAATAPGIVVSGRVVNVSTGAPLPGVTILTCTSSNPVTDSAGRWQILVPTSTLYCARIGGGVPGGLTGPVATNNNTETFGGGSYEHQTAGVNCYHNASCTAVLQAWDRSFDGNVDFAFRTAPVKTPTPVPAPVKPPMPAPTAAPVVPTPSSPTPEPTTSATPSPSPSSQATPNPVATEVTFTSDDKVATVAVPVLNIPDGSICKVDKQTPPNPPSGFKTIAGSYRLICTSGAGQSVALDGITAAWQINLKDLIGKSSSPKAVATNGSATKVIDSSYDKKTHILGIKTSAVDGVSVVVPPASTLWLNLIVIGVGILVIVAFVLFFPLRVHRRRSYQEYLRNKYYDL